MSKKNDTPVLILSLLITIALLGVGVWWLTSRFNLGNLSNLVNSPGTSSGQNAGNSNGGGAVPVEQRLSVGDRLLIPEGASADKQAGVEAIAAGNFDLAVTDLKASLQADRNDPEALIYLNNAQIGNQTAHTIAVAVPAGTAVNSAQEILRGVAQAQNEVNQAGGINGVLLRVMIVSDDNDPNTAEQVARALVADSSVLGVIGHFGSDASLRAAPVYEQGKLVMVSPTSTSVQLSEAGSYIFRTVPSDRFTATALSRYLVNTLGRQNAAVFFNSGSVYSTSLKDEFTTALYGDGGQIVSEVDLANPGFSAADSVEQATQQNAEVLVLLPNTATLDPALQVALVNRQQLPMLGGDSVYNPKTLQVGGESAVGMVVAVPWDLLANVQAPFVQGSRRLWGADVNWRSAMSYDATQVLIAGLRRAPNREGLEQALRDSGFSVSGATGTVRFLPSGDRNQSVQLVEVKPGRRSGFGFDFEPAK